MKRHVEAEVGYRLPHGANRLDGPYGAMIGGLLTTIAVSGLKGLLLAKKMFVG